jgi:hypothetical protein
LAGFVIALLVTGGDTARSRANGCDAVRNPLLHLLNASAGGEIEISDLDGARNQLIALRELLTGDYDLLLLLRSCRTSGKKDTR